MSKAKREPKKGVRKVSFAEAPTLTVYQLFENTPGPLPLISEKFTTNGGDFLLSISGSAYRESGSGIIAFDIYVDNNLYGWSEICANNSLVHMATIPVTLLIQDLEAGEHTVTLQAEEGTTTDGNDFFNASAEEYVVLGQNS